MIRFLQTGILTLFLALAGPALADDQYSRTVGDYVVYYNAFTTDTLAPQVAKQYGIKRSRNRAMFSIAVQKKVMGMPGKPVHAKVTGRAINLNNQVKQLKPREVVDGTAIYYIGELSVAHRETLTFEFRIQPEGTAEPFTITFRKTFYTN